MKQKGVGPVTALAFLLTLGPAERFPNSRKVVSYLGLNQYEGRSWAGWHHHGLSFGAGRGEVHFPIHGFGLPVKTDLQQIPSQFVIPRDITLSLRCRANRRDSHSRGNVNEKRVAIASYSFR